jgi:hypothetical protein
MQDPDNSDDETEELNNLLSDQYIAVGRVRELLDGYASVCEVEKQLLREDLADNATQAKPEETS